MKLKLTYFFSIIGFMFFLYSNGMNYSKELSVAITEVLGGGLVYIVSFGIVGFILDSVIAVYYHYKK
jgi:hypothetical protein